MRSLESWGISAEIARGTRFAVGYAESQTTRLTIIFENKTKRQTKRPAGINQLDFLAAPHTPLGTWNTSLVASDVSIVSSFQNQRIQKGY